MEQARHVDLGTGVFDFEFPDFYGLEVRMNTLYMDWLLGFGLVLLIHQACRSLRCAPERNHCSMGCAYRGSLWPCDCGLYCV